MSQVDFDIAIIGAGIVGLTAALALGRDWKVLLIDDKRHIFSSTENTIEERCFAISRTGEKLFKRIQIWPDIADKLSPYNKMHIWDERGFGEIIFDANDYREDNLGYILTANTLMDAMHKRLQNYVTYIADNALENIIWQDDTVKLSFKNKESLICKLLIGADGINSKVRDLANIKIKKKIYKQHALIGTLTIEEPHQNTAWQRFTPTGPIAFLPLPDQNRVSFVWSENNSELTNKWLKICDKSYNKELARLIAKKFDYSFGKVTVLNQPKCFPLINLSVENYAFPKGVLIGDAAHHVHPLAGLGLNLGLADVATLVEILLEVKTAGGSINLPAGLEKYQHIRKAENIPIMRFIDILQSLFIIPQSGVEIIRNIGLLTVNNSKLLKRYFINKALEISDFAVN